MKNNYEKIKDILEQHCGKENAIPSHSISEEIGYPMEATQAVSRKEIHKTAEKYNMPLLSCHRGFFLAETAEELDEYNKNIDSRMQEMDRKRNVTNENFWRKYYGN